jgi:hypothetical protein
VGRMNASEHTAMRRLLHRLLAALNHSSERLADALWGPRPRRYKPAPLLGKLLLFAGFGTLLALGVASCLAKL